MKVKIVIVTALVVVLGLALSNLLESDQMTETQDSFGTVEGALTYPSNKVPEDVVVCALDIASGAENCNFERIKSEEYSTGVGYRISLRPGSYHMFIRYPAEPPSSTAYYNEYMRDYATSNQWSEYSDFNCRDLKPLNVIVGENDAIKGIALGDWYFEQECN